jgi:signal transduction histidine kinase
MATPQPSFPLPSANTACAVEIEQEAGRLALHLAEMAAADPDAIALKDDVLALLVAALRVEQGALYQCTSRARSASRSLIPMASLGLEGDSARALCQVARMAVIEGRMLLVPSPEAHLPIANCTERMLALPIGAPSPVGVLAVGWSAHRPNEDEGWRVPLLIRLAPALALVMRSSRSAGRSTSRTVRRSVAQDERPDLLALMSHELRTPLNTINGFVEIVLDGLAGPLADRQREFLTYAHTSTRQLTRLIEDMLFLAREDGNRALARRAAIAADAPVQLALASIEDVAHARRIMLEVEIASDLPRLHGDGARLARALGNLLAFAVHRTLDGGAISLEVRRTAGDVVYLVSDRGPAVSAQELAQLFEPLRPQPGIAANGLTGLELAITHSIATQHGGTLSAEALPESGTRLRLAIPVYQ